MAQITLNSSGVASNGTLALQSNGTTTAVTVDASQNVGVGTASPIVRFNVTDASDGSPSGTMRLGSDGTYYAQNQFRYNSSEYRIGVYGAGQFMSLYTAGSERARIDSSGTLLVGKTATGTAVGIDIQSDGTIRSVKSGSTSATSSMEVYSTGAGAYRFFVGMEGTVYATNTAISSLSDQRHKENIRDLNVGLDKIMALKPRLFDWKEGKGQDIKNARGFIAQEFEAVFPDLIDTWKDPAPEGEEPYKSVRADLIPILVKAIQEQQAIIESLKARLDAANL